jgi:hypothetical protein
MVTALVALWRDSTGALWTSNTLAQVDMLALKLAGQTWIISQVAYMKGQAGTQTLVTLMPPEAFQPEPTLDTSLDPQISQALQSTVTQANSQQLETGGGIMDETTDADRGCHYRRQRAGPEHSQDAIFAALPDDAEYPHGRTPRHHLAALPGADAVPVSSGMTRVMRCALGSMMRVITIKTTGGTGTVRIEGRLEVTQEMTAIVDGAAVHLSTHEHSGVQGGGTSARPVPNT